MIKRRQFWNVRAWRGVLASVGFAWRVATRYAGVFAYMAPDFPPLEREVHPT